MTTLFVVLGVTLGTSFLCSVLEAVFLSMTDSHIALMQERGEWAGQWLAKAQKRVNEPIAAILTLNTIAHTLGAALGGAMAAEVFGSVWVGVFSGVLTLVILLFTEIVPKTVGATYWKQLAKPTAYVLQGMVVLMKPVIVPLGLLSRLINPSKERPTVSRAELEVLANIGLREGAIGEGEWQVMTNVMRLEGVTVAEVMTPRMDIVALPVDASVDEAKARMITHGHFRLPVFEDSLDRIVGVILARDLWKADWDGVLDIRGIVRPVPFTPASKLVEGLIREMRSQRAKLAIVVDEFGGTAGLVTLGDLIEEVIGDIQDEHGTREPESFVELPDGSVRVWAGVSLREAGDHLGFEDADDEGRGYDSLGGFVFGRLNRIPQVGDHVRVESGTLRVVRMRDRRVEYLLFLPSGDPEPSASRD